MNKYILTLLCGFISCFANSEIVYEKPEWKIGELKVYEHWFSAVSTRQHTLGSCVIKARRQGLEKISDLTSEELQELTIVMKEVENALMQCFQPDRFNYLQLGNGVHQLHFHLIPRYDSSREFAGLSWEDPTFGGPPLFTDYKPPLEIIAEIKEVLVNSW